MLLLSILIWYFRRTEPLTLRDLQKCCAVVMLVVCLVPAEVSVCVPCQAKDADSQPEKQLLREGTRIPPTTGQIVMVGRRWAFVPVKQQAEADAVASRYPSVSHALMITEARRRATRLGSSGSDYGRNRFRSASVPMEEMKPTMTLSFDQITLQENLMLQRIVKSIRVDPTDDHWIISGEITEFFNDNRLLIQVAQRANRR